MYVGENKTLSHVVGDNSSATELSALTERVSALETNATDTNTRVEVLESAVENLSKLNVVKVDSLDEMVDPNVIYLLPSDDGSYYYEYLLFNGTPEIIGNTDIDLTGYVSKSFLRDSAKMYRHNITLKYRHSNSKISSSGSDGTFVATFELINDDPTPYTFTHNQDYSVYKAIIMPLDTAWQFLRLYQAIQLSRSKNLNLARSCSGTTIIPDTASPYTARYCINNSISTKYFDFDDTDWKRMLVVHGTQVDDGNIGTKALEISCGHPQFANDVETSIWTSKEEFAEREYNLTDSFGKAYSTYFCQQRIYCTDSVEELKLHVLE